MKRVRKNQGGSTVIVVVIIILVVAVAGFAGWRVMGNKKDKDKQNSTNTTTQLSNSNLAAPANDKVSWNFNGNSWQTNGTAPSCTNPIALASPVDVKLATAMLYPGQYRGGDYKSHGGFRFDGSKNADITVKVPLDSQLYKGSRYIEQGETQYFFVFIAPCGIMYRFDHLLTLSPQFQAYADKLPAAKVNDSRTTNFTPEIYVKQGDVVATAVGFKNSNNVSVDFGVNDIRKPNAISKDSMWMEKHTNDKEYAPYGICWFDLLPAKDAAIVKALPGGDGASGKTSDYCK